MNTFETVRNIVVRQLDLNENFSLTEETDFVQMGLDSLDFVDLVMSIEEEFDIEIPDEDLEKLQNFGEMVSYIDSIK